MDRPPAIDPAIVQEFVGNAHGDLNRVKELLAQEPNLANATWDWGGGDWESAIGAAAHTGSKEIAHCLLEHGARMDLFVAAMLGKLEIVRATLEAIPEARNVKGPHGIPLMAHATFGGEEAAPVVAYLESFGIA